MTGVALILLGVWVLLQTTKGPLATKLGISSS